MKIWGRIDETGLNQDEEREEHGIALKKSKDSEESSPCPSDVGADGESSEAGDNGSPRYHQANPEAMREQATAHDHNRDFRKQLNRDAREAVSHSIHKGVRLVVHRPEYDAEHEREYAVLSKELTPVVREMARKTLPLLEHEQSSEFARHHYYGGKFQADSVVYRDFRHFAKKRPPNERPSLAVGLRVDESASMAAFGRLEASKRAAIAVYEFCQMCEIPVSIYGDTADVTKLEQMSIFVYADLHKPDSADRYRLMAIRARSNNRDGMALRFMAERLAAAPHKTKLLISLSDGQPKAMDDYTGGYAASDMQRTIAEYERKGVTFLAAAIGQDKEVIGQIYGNGKFLDITNLNELPAKLVRLISRYVG